MPLLRSAALSFWDIAIGSLYRGLGGTREIIDIAELPFSQTHIRYRWVVSSHSGIEECIFDQFLEWADNVVIPHLKNNQLVEGGLYESAACRGSYFLVTKIHGHDVSYEEDMSRRKYNEDAANFRCLMIRRVQ